MTATATSFAAMLNDYLANDLLKEEFVKRDWLLSTVEKDDGWVGAVGSSTNGGALIVPFKGAYASSVAWGALTDTTDIAEDKYVRGQINTQPEFWGTMLFKHRDLMEHNKVSEKNFLKLLPDTVEDFMDYCKNAVSTSLLNGGAVAVLTVAGTSLGIVTVDHPERFTIGQRISLYDGNTAAATYYVTNIDMNAQQLTLSSTRGGSTADVSAYTVDQAATIYHPGSQSYGFSSLRGLLLSSANGGTSSIYGVTKTAYPYCQAINVDGSNITSVNILEKIFDAWTRTRAIGRGNPTEIVMSYKHFGSCMKVIEASKGAFNVKPGSQTASQYGWTEITIGSVTSQNLKLVGVQEMPDDLIFFLDMRGIKFYSNGFFRKRESPSGNQYFEVRDATNGYSYIVDVCLFGDLVVNRPSYQGVLYGISY